MYTSNYLQNVHFRITATKIFSANTTVKIHQCFLDSKVYHQFKK